ncbi:related to small s protein [Fusarium fujikuroi]|nr:related to small s protein [Fusarium fujikuroi]
MLLVMLISQRDSAQHIRPAQPDQAAYFSSSLPLTSERQIITLERNIMLTGFEALGAASAVLQVISFATDVIVACKNAYDGATTSQDDLQRYAGQMSEAIGRVHTRCEYMRNANSKFASPKLQDIAKQCKEAAKKLEAEVQYVTGLQAKGDLVKSLRKAFRASRHQKKIQALHESLSMYQQVVITEITSHLCSQSDAIYMQQDVSFGKLDIDVQFLISQLAQGITGVENLVKQEHTATRNIIVKESARAEVAINSHMDKQALELRTASETKKKCEVFLQSLKAPLMNHRYNDIMDSTEASFNQVFASYEDMKTMYHYDSESDGSATDDQEAENLEDDDSPDEDASGDDGNGSDSDHDSLVEDIHQSWASLNTWLQSTDKLFYIRGKPGSGKSTLIKFIGQQEQTNKLLQRWSPDATILSYFFWKIGSEEQKSLKGLWCSLLHQRLEDQQQLIPSILQNFNILSRHSQHHDWAMKDLQIVWNYLADVDTRHLCIFIDGLDEIRNEDGFSELLETIDAMLVNPKIKICVSTRPEASIVRWLKTKKAAGILLEDLTRYDMLVFVQKRFHKLSSDIQVSSETIRHLRHKLVDKALGVFLWLHLATRSIIEGIENVDSEDMLISRLNALPGNLENLYIDMWQRMNAKSPVYAETARRYFRYVLQHPERIIFIFTSQRWYRISQPWILQFTCAENPEILEKLLKRANMMDLAEILQRCEDTKASIQSQCAGLLEVRQNKGAYLRLFKRLGDNSNAFAQVAFIHRTAHDFLIDTEAGQSILGYGPLNDISSETRLLNGLISTVIIITSKLQQLSTDTLVIKIITEFAKRRGNEGLQLATNMFDIVRPLYDRKHIRLYEDLWIPSSPFFSFLTDEHLFDDYVISRLATETSTDLATSLLLEGWAPRRFRSPFKKLSKRVFATLIKFGADPHEYGILYDEALQPFARKITAFTNLLVSFITSKKLPDSMHPLCVDGEVSRNAVSETLEIAIDMAVTCQNLNAVVSLFSSIRGTGPMITLPLEGSTLSSLGQPMLPIFRHLSDTVFIFYEVNLQFLLLYLLSKIGGSLTGCILATPQAQDVLSRIDRPLVKIRYFRLPPTAIGMPEDDIWARQTFQCILSPKPLPINDVEQLFDVDFNGFSQDLCKPRDDRTDLYTFKECIKNTETEDVNIEHMMTSLAAENLGFCTYEEAGITPSYEYLRKAKETIGYRWRYFPLAMGRLEAAAVIREGTEGHE